MTEQVLRPKWLEPEPYYERHNWFFDSWKRRHSLNKNIIICSTGQSLGIGKSYWLLSVFEEADPDFTVDQVVFVPSQFWGQVDALSKTEWHPIMWDDPTRGLNKREWMDAVNKTVTSFMKTSSRYKRKDLGFAVPAMDDLDIAVREIMTLEAQMKEAGLAKVHRIKRNKFGTPPFWKPFLGEVQRPMPKCWREYEAKREAFHKESYKKEEFSDEKKEGSSLQVFQRVYQNVRADPVKFKDSNSGKWSALQVSALVEPPCSYQIARKVIARIEYEDAASASKSST